MKKLIQKIKAFYQRKGYEPNLSQEPWDTATTNIDTANGNNTTSSFEKLKPSKDIVEMLLTAKNEVDAFEKTIKILKQKVEV